MLWERFDFFFSICANLYSSAAISPSSHIPQKQTKVLFIINQLTGKMILICLSLHLCVREHMAEMLRVCFIIHTCVDPLSAHKHLSDVHTYNLLHLSPRSAGLTQKPYTENLECGGICCICIKHSCKIPLLHINHLHDLNKLKQMHKWPLLSL